MLRPFFTFTALSIFTVMNLATAAQAQGPPLTTISFKFEGTGIAGYNLDPIFDFPIFGSSAEAEAYAKAKAEREAEEMLALGILDLTNMGITVVGATIHKKTVTVIHTPGRGLLRHGRSGVVTATCCIEGVIHVHNDEALAALLLSILTGPGI